MSARPVQFPVKGPRRKELDVEDLLRCHPPAQEKRTVLSSAYEWPFARHSLESGVRKTDGAIPSLRRNANGGGALPAVNSGPLSQALNALLVRLSGRRRAKETRARPCRRVFILGAGAASVHELCLL